MLLATIPTSPSLDAVGDTEHTRTTRSKTWRHEGIMEREMPAEKLGLVTVTGGPVVRVGCNWSQLDEEVVSVDRVTVRT